jgi:hypothetical protein
MSDRICKNCEWWEKETGDTCGLDFGRCEYAVPHWVPSIVKDYRSWANWGAMRWLCPELRRVASIGIVDATAGINATFLAIGRLTLPGASGAEQTGGGKAALVITCRELAVFYGLRRRAG